ncbi:helix-turn-helix transcriptional regulator, partial [Candidatus Gracilibacteria bacterium]|nr:helix-turn-helix transcriptional regulator [Candidatus Gracilibacteria bacterium]
MTSAVDFGGWLRQRRRELDLTQADLAQRVGCSTITIRKLESGLRVPSRQMATLLADVLLLPTDERARFVASARG